MGNIPRISWRTTYKILECCSVEFTFDKFIRPISELLIQEGYRVDTSYFSSCPDALNKTHHQISIPRSFSCKKILQSIRRAIQILQNEYDIVHVHTPVAALVFRVASIFSPKTKVVYTVHGYYFHENMRCLEYTIHFLVEFFLSFCTDLALFVSSEDYHFASKYFKLSRCKNALIRNGADSRHFMPASPTQKSVGKIELGIPEDDIVVIYVGRIVEEKGVLDLFQAIEEISKNITNISVVFVGGVLPSDRDQQTYTHLKSLTSCSRVNYIFTGFVDDPLPFYRASDIFCLPLGEKDFQQLL